MSKNYPNQRVQTPHKMSYPARYELLLSVRERYFRSSRREKSKILDEICANTGFHRKHAIRALNNLIEPRQYREKRGNKKKYDFPEFIDVLKNLRVYSGNVCAELFKSQIAVNIPRFEKRFYKLRPEIKELLHTVSISTLKRILPGAYEAKSGVHRHYKSASKLYGKIPLQSAYPPPQEPGCIEADLVEHNGGDPSGQYLYTLCGIDKVSSWLSRRCVKNKSAASVHGGLNYIKEKIPYPITWVDTDNGSEFLNALIIKWTEEHEYRFTHSRAGKKNDNAHVERANRVYVRELIGYGRFMSNKAYDLINKIYLLDDLYVNFFIPCRRIIRKEYDKRTGKTRKIYDEPQTPYQRVVSHFGKETQCCKELSTIYEALDPWELHEEREKLLRQLSRLKK